MSAVLTYDDTLSRVQIVGGGWTPNPGFEVDTTGWAAIGGTIDRVTDQSYTGVASLRLTPDGVTGVPIAQTAVPESPAATPTVAYRLVGQMYSPAGWSQVSLAIVWLDAADAVISTSATTIVAIAADTWVRYELDATAPALTAKAQLRARMHGTPAVSDVLYVDDMRLVPQDGTATVERSTNGITWSIVRGGTAVPAELVELSDYEFVNAVSNSYRVTYKNSVGSTVFTDGPYTITPTITRVWLKSIIRPFLNQAVFTTDNISGPQRPARYGSHPIIGRSLPVATTDVRSGMTISIEVNVETQFERNKLDFLLASGDILFVHTPEDFQLPSFYAVAGDSDEARTGPGSPMRNFSLPLVAHAPPGPDIVGSTTTWNDVVANYATWNDVVLDKDTWNDVLRRIADPDTVIVP